ncbi:MAG: glycosyltransferase, partial [Actinomycetota bacterium]|nr:glycosyltransferase [Actinomycetota bacterium]
MNGRPEVAGKFFRVGGEKLYIRGITYGPFRPGDDGEPYDRLRIGQDFARIAAEGANTIRLYTTPPAWLLDAAADHGLLVMAGLAWEQHVAFLEEGGRGRAIADRIAREVEGRAGHPALLAWVVGNEIPSPVARWYGARRTRGFVSKLYEAAKAADPGALVTYVNYPSTEYLELDFLDFVCFNVFLESRGPFEAYLHRLQNIADERPLVLTEIGLDSASNGEQAQAESIDWQVRGAYAAGCAGAFVFSWTDEWHRGGQEIEGWRFGVTDRERRPKPALSALRAAFADVPVPTPADAPRVSVLICTNNGARTLGETCEAVTRLRYPDFEVIVVDDGSNDRTAEIAHGYDFRVISTANHGLASARNTGLEAATGELVAYVDDDAAPDPHWLLYLAEVFRETDCVAAGGPNIAVPGDGPVADAVAAAPGNPTHVLVSDREAEHIPGCNAAFRADALREIGGFDEQFRAAGDDVDVCWRLLDRGGWIAYVAPAMVWHHRRSSVRGYLVQQRAYGRAEAMLERKWPERYSAGGHVTWQGRIYGPTAPRHATGPLRWRVYHGVWGTALFQSLYQPARGNLDTVLLMPEAYLAIGFGTALVALGTLWAPLFLLAPPLALAVGVLAVRAMSAAARARFQTPRLTPRERAIRQAITALLHL